MVPAARAGAGTVLGASGVPGLSTSLPSLPARRPPLTWGRLPGPLAPLGGVARAEWRCVCPEREGAAWPGLKRPLRPQGFLCLQKQPGLQPELRKSQVGGGWLLQGLERALTQSCHSEPRESPAQGPQAPAQPCTLTPHPAASLTCIHFLIQPCPCSTSAVPYLSTFSLPGTFTWGLRGALQTFVQAGSPTPNALPSHSLSG